VFHVTPAIVPGHTLSWSNRTPYEQSEDQAVATRVIKAWAPDPRLEDIVIDRPDDRLRVTIRLAGTEPPPPSSSLADLLAAELDEDVVAGVIFSQVDEASTAPG
jgi:hypothetical protein